MVVELTTESTEDTEIIERTSNLTHHASHMDYMFDLQNIIVAVLLLGAVAYAATVFLRKTRSFSAKGACADDCGCSSKTKSPKIAH